jgi:diguanylate cyclase (GGDEF)-like protein/PAS domain S-box-containing protein
MTATTAGALEASTVWARALTATGGPRVDDGQIDALAGQLARTTAAGLASGPAAQDAGRHLGQLLVQARLTSPAVLGAAVGVVAATDGPARLVHLMQGSLATSHAAEVQRLLLAEQEVAHRASTLARDHAVQALLASEARFRALFAEAPVGIAIVDPEGRIHESNAAMQDMLGYSQAEFRDLHVQTFIYPDDSASLWTDYAALIAGDIEALSCEKRYVHKDGHVVWANLSLSLVRGPDDGPLFQVAVLQDVTERRALQRQLLHQAQHDALTGLPNRALFLAELDRALAGPGPGGRIAVLSLDLDGFKRVNDSRGHLAGDQVLRVVADRLAVVARRRGGLLARLGGDEFVVLLAGHHGATPVEVAEELLAVLDAPVAVPGQQPVHVRASIGVVEAPATGSEAADLLSAADLAVNAAKEDGRGRVVAHDPHRTARQLSRFAIAMNLPGVVERGELDVAYQPLVRLDGSGLHTVEALLRWKHPQLGDLSPEVFVGIAEEEAAIVPIGRWVLERACADLAGSDWPAVNVNASARQLYARDFVDDVRRCLELGRIPPERLRIEVTESIVMQADDPAPLRTLRRLADLGIRIVMDDFGTGYSNLAALRAFPFHELKLAATFLAGVGPDRPVDPVDLTILSTIVDLAHTLDLLVTVEGVENAAQDALVRRVGCDVGQGWFYHPPAPHRMRAPGPR